MGKIPKREKATEKRKIFPTTKFRKIEKGSEDIKKSQNKETSKKKKNPTRLQKAFVSIWYPTQIHVHRSQPSKT